MKNIELLLSTHEEIISLVIKGRRYRQIGADLKLNYSTVRYIIKKREETKSVENKTRSGRLKKLSTKIGSNCIK